MPDTQGMIEVQMHCGELKATWQVPSTTRLLRIPKSRSVDVKAAVRRALDDPDGYPPVRHAVVGGDQIVIAFSACVPDGERLLAITAAYFLESGIAPEQLSILLAERCSFAADRFFALLSENLQERMLEPVSLDHLHAVQVIQGPFAQNDFAYLAADANANPIYIHRRLVDADFVLPIVQLSSYHDLQTAAVGGIAPWFCDRDTIRRWNGQHVAYEHTATSPSEHTKDLQWLIGPTVAMVVHNCWSEVHDSIRVQSSDKVGQTICPPSPDSFEHQSADVIAASMEPRELQVNWSIFAETVAHCVQRCIPERARILLACRQLPRKTPALQTWLEYASDEDELLRQLSQLDDPFAVDIATIAGAMLSHSLFTIELAPRKTALSLPWETVEDAGQCESILRTAKSAIVFV